jgi:hypothetical protein
VSSHSTVGLISQPVSSHSAVGLIFSCIRMGSFSLVDKSSLIVFKVHCSQGWINP